jgi:acyl-CoA hydrolase
MQDKLTFQFISEPTDINFGGKVHGGSVMKWIDQTAYACAAAYAESYCVTVYVGGIRFYSPIHIGDLVKINAKVIYTGQTSIHIAVDVFTRKISEKKYRKTTHCVVVFVSVDELGKPKLCIPFVPKSDLDKNLEKYALKLIELRKNIEAEMAPFLKDYL